MIKTQIKCTVDYVGAHRMSTNKRILIWGVCLNLTCVLLVTSCHKDPTFSSTTGPETINLGRHITTNWRSNDFSGTSYREWSGDVDYFRFHFTETSGAQIGLIGKMRDYIPNWGGVQVDSLPASLVMSTNARMDKLVGTQYTFGIYGWTHEKDTSWTGNGWNNEFYINFQGRPATAESGRVFTSTFTMDGIIFDCYTYAHPPWMAPTQTQWVVESRTQTWNTGSDCRARYSLICFLSLLIQMLCIRLIKGINTISLIINMMIIQ